MSLNPETTAAPSREADLTPVLFRMSEGEVTAVFICEPYNHTGREMACYAHIGQHSACSWQWVRQSTRAATPAEYEPLKRELESIGYQLRVFKYRTRPHKFAFDAALKRLQGL